MRSSGHARTREGYRLAARASENSGLLGSACGARAMTQFATQGSELRLLTRCGVSDE